jgi:hypothetical protein
MAKQWLWTTTQLPPREVGDRLPGMCNASVTA